MRADSKASHLLRCTKSAHPRSTVRSTLSTCTYAPCPLASYKCLDLSCTSRKVRSHSFVVKEKLGRAPPSQEDIWSNFLEERMEGKDSKRVLFLEEKGIEQGSALARLFSRIILKDRCIGPGVMFPETRSSLKKKKKLKRKCRSMFHSLDTRSDKVNHPCHHLLATSSLSS